MIPPQLNVTRGRRGARFCTNSLADEVAAETGLKHPDAKAAIESMLRVMSRHIVAGEIVELYQFGMFRAITKKFSMGKMRKGTQMIRIVKFRVARGLKAMVRSKS